MAQFYQTFTCPEANDLDFRKLNTQRVIVWDMLLFRDFIGRQVMSTMPMRTWQKNAT